MFQGGLMVGRVTVNHYGVGSNPTLGAKFF